MAMDLNYGIGVKNRYALFMGDDESDPLDIISKCKEEASLTAGAAGEKGAATSNAHSSAPSTGAKTAASRKDVHHSNKKTSGATSASTNLTATIPHTAGGGNTGENRSQNRPPRQDRGPKPHYQNTNTSGFGSSQENSWSNSGFSASRDQKEIEEKKNRRNREDRPFTQNNSEFRDRGDEGKGKMGPRPGGRGGFRGNGSRGGRGGRGGSFDSRGKREYDRQSGSDKTGIKPNEKREGSGSFNWGTFTDELEGQTNPTQDENPEKSGDEHIFDSEAKENEVVTDDAEKAKESEENAEEEAAKEMTYDEWKKIEDEKRAKPIFNIRKPGEGEDVAQWKKTFVLKKKVEEEGDEEEYEEIEEEETKHGRQKRILDIEINFKDENRDSRRGRGRGGPRGGSGRGGAAPAGERRERPDRGERGGERPERAERGSERPERGQGNRRGGNQPFRGRDAKEQSTPRVDDFNDFPSLAAA